MLTQIRRCFVELDRFWTKEICRAVEALKMRRVDPSDVERWKSIHPSLDLTVKSWKVRACSSSLHSTP